MKKDHVNSSVKHTDSKVYEAPKELKEMKETNEMQEVQMSNAAKSVSFGTVRDELIRETAYSCYQARNQEGDHALQDWLQAEKLVNQMPGKIDLGRESFQTS